MSTRETEPADSKETTSQGDPREHDRRQHAKDATDPEPMSEAAANASDDAAGDAAGDEPRGARRLRLFGGDRKLQEKLAQAEARIAELQQERDRLQDQVARTLADMQNLRRQTQRQREESRGLLLGQLVSEFLPILDNLERAAQSSGDLEELRKGLAMIHAMFMGCLERHGVERVAAEGRPFDPTQHEALMIDPRDDVAPGTVTAEIEPGFRIGERIVRIAKVRVSAPGTAGAQPPKPAGE